MEDPFESGRSWPTARRRSGHARRPHHQDLRRARGFPADRHSLILRISNASNRAHLSHSGRRKSARRGL